jgi:hypothetical protein
LPFPALRGGQSAIVLAPEKWHRFFSAFVFTKAKNGPVDFAVASLKRFGNLSTIIYFQNLVRQNYLLASKEIQLCLSGIERNHKAPHTRIASDVALPYGFLCVADVSFSFCYEFDSTVRRVPYFYR